MPLSYELAGGIILSVLNMSSLSVFEKSYTYQRRFSHTLDIISYLLIDFKLDA